jgi:hypothetical protein
MFQCHVAHAAKFGRLTTGFLVKPGIRVGGRREFRYSVSRYGNRGCGLRPLASASSNSSKSWDQLYTLNCSKNKEIEH